MMFTERTYIGGTIEQFSIPPQSLQSIGIDFYYYSHKIHANIMDHTPCDQGEVTSGHQISAISLWTTMACGLSVSSVSMRAIFDAKAILIGLFESLVI